MIELVEMEIRELLTEMGFDGENVQVIKGSALCALEGKEPQVGKEAIDKLLAAIDSAIPTPERDLDRPFMLPVEHTYSIPGRGTVVTGRLERGKIKKGMEGEIIGFTKTFKVNITGIEMFHKILEEGHAGDQMGALVKGVKRDDVRRGMVLAKPGSVRQCDNIEAQIYMLTEAEGGASKPIITFGQVQMFSKTFDIAAQVNIVGNKTMAMPGEDCTINLKLIKPVVLEQGQRFTLRLGKVTLGTGVVSKVEGNLSEAERLQLMEGKKKRDKRMAAGESN